MVCSAVHEYQLQGLTIEYIIRDFVSNIFSTITVLASPSPSFENIVFNRKLIQNLSYEMVRQILYGLWLVVKPGIAGNITTPISHNFSIFRR